MGQLPARPFFLDPPVRLVIFPPQLQGSLNGKRREFVCRKAGSFFAKKKTKGRFS
jgi:hypothetical protein